MNKLLVEIMLPAAEQTYDIYIPLDSKLRDITKLLTSLFSELAAGKFAPAEPNLLCDAQTGKILDMNKNAAELGLMNGSKLLLV
jgi:hypothetical protein